VRHIHIYNMVCGLSGARFMCLTLTLLIIAMHSNSRSINPILVSRINIVCSCVVKLYHTVSHKKCNPGGTPLQRIF